MNEQLEKALGTKQRPMTRFWASELMLDFVEGQLDPERQRAMEEFLVSARESNRDLTTLKKGLSYANDVGQLKIGDDLIRRLETTKTGWSKWAERLAWANWPDMARWIAEGVLISLAVAVVVSVLPIKKLARFLPKVQQEVVLVEVPRVENLESDSRSVESKVTTESASPEVKVAPAPTSSVAAPPKAVANPASPTSTQTASEQEPAPVQDQTPAQEPVPQAPPTAQELAEANSSAVESKAVGKGFVYRAFMATATLPELTETVKNLVVGMGGEKAGQVDLGWRKGNGSYFHFSLPESNYETLLAELRNFGPVRISKDSHWRVMPEGKIRIILFIEDAAQADSNNP